MKKSAKRAAAAAARAADYARVAMVCTAALGAHRLCNETKEGGVCQLDAGHRLPHRARVGERIATDRGPRRQIIEWGIGGK